MNKIIPSIKTANQLVLFLICSLTFMGCAATTSQYISVNKINTLQKDPNSIEECYVRPKKSAICLGYISSNGNEYSSQKDVLLDAKKTAAAIGGDFILMEDSGVETETKYEPAFSKYEMTKSNKHDNAKPNQNTFQKNVSNVFEGPSLTTSYFPWSKFSVWVFTPSNLGLEYNQDYIITGFHLYSDADTAGLKIGDKIRGINNIDVHDEQLANEIMRILPGDKVKITVIRSQERLEFHVTAFKN